MVRIKIFPVTPDSLNLTSLTEAMIICLNELPMEPTVLWKEIEQRQAICRIKLLISKFILESYLYMKNFREKLFSNFSRTDTRPLAVI